MTRLWTLSLALQSVAALSLAPTTTPRMARAQPLHMSASGADNVEIYAAQDGRRVAVSGLQPKSQEGQEYVSVPPAEAPMPPSLVQRVKGPFMGVTLLATAAIAAWQSNQVYRQRQDGLLEEFASTIVFHMGDQQELSTAISQFRKQLGPGSFKAPMYQAFLIALASDVAIGVDAIDCLKQVTAMMKVSDSVAASCLEGASKELVDQPSVLNKLVFVAERALPMPSASAKLRSRFPNWSLDTVTALQRAMLENLYRDTYCDEDGARADGATLATLGLSEADAARLMQEVIEKKAEAERAAAEAAAEAERAQQLQDALIAASELKQMKTISTSDDDADDDYTPSSPDVTPASGTHEYECTKCGYILFPAAGRETKFFGAGYTCPQCGCGKDEFVDNGPVDMD